jgi:hypothetical protein
VGQVDQALGPTSIAEFRIGKFRDGPARGIEDIVHSSDLMQ